MQTDTVSSDIGRQTAASLFYPAACGTSALWHQRRNSCFWTDGANLYERSWKDHKVAAWNPGIKISLLLEHQNGDLILAGGQCLFKFNFQDGTASQITPQIYDTGYQCTVGKCDCAGRIWSGYAPLEKQYLHASLYRLSEKVSPRKMIGGLVHPAGIAWSIDNERMYFADAAGKSVKSYFFQKSSGDITFERVLIEIPEDAGMPVDMATDEEGMLWIALSGSGLVTRWDPRTGKLIDSVKVPVPNVTGCTFAGADLRSLVITTTRRNLSEAQLKKYPGSGSIFMVKDAGVKGTAVNSVSCL